MITIYLFTDEPVLAKGLDAVLSRAGEFRLECVLGGLPELLPRLEAALPDILLLDLTPGLTLGALSDIRRAAPRCNLVVWVNSISTEMAFQAMGLGVRGILRKNLAPNLLIACLRKVHAGELWFEKALTDSFLTAKRVALSEREGQLVTLLAYGLRNREIASMLRITEGTVKVYLSRLFQKAGVKDRFELALFGLKNLPGGLPAIAETAGRDGIPSLRSMMLSGAQSRNPGDRSVPRREWGGHRGRGQAKAAGLT